MILMLSAFHPSFPRRRESRVEQEVFAFVALDSRLRGNDEGGAE